MSDSIIAWPSFLKDVILILIGAIIGFGASYLSDRRQTQKTRISTLTLIRSFVIRETDLAKELHSSLSEEVNNPSDTLFLADALRWHHDPTLYLSVSGSVGLLEPEIVRAYTIFYGSIKQCQQLRDIAVQKYQENPKASKLGSPFQLYLIGLESILN